jgi:hypothetical protein
LTTEDTEGREELQPPIIADNMDLEKTNGLSVKIRGQEFTESWRFSLFGGSLPLPF